MDGSEDALITMKGIGEYKIPLPEIVFQMIEETDSEEDDEFEELSSEPGSDLD